MVLNRHPYRIKLTTYDIRDYGAVADLNADMSSYIQKAIDAAVDAGGGTVYIPAGIYHIEAQINLPQNNADYYSYPLHFVGDGHASVLMKTFNGNMFSGIGTFPNNRVRLIDFENIRLSSDISGGLLIYLVHADMMHFYNVLFDGRGNSDVGISSSGAIEGTDTWDLTFVDCFFRGLGSPTRPIVQCFAVTNNCNEWKFTNCRFERGVVNNSVCFQSIGAANKNHSMIFIGCKFHGQPGSISFTSSALVFENTRWSQVVHTTEMYHNAHGGYVITLDEGSEQNLIAWNYTYNQGSQIALGMVNVAGDNNIIGPNFHSQNAYSVAEVTNTGIGNLKLSTVAL